MGSASKEEDVLAGIKARGQGRGKDTVIGGGEVLVQHPVEDVGDVRLEGVPRACVDVLPRHLPKGHGGALRKRRVKEGRRAWTLLR